MRARAIIAGILFACAAGAALAGCGEDSGSDEPASAATVTTETADPLPKLPRGWTSTVNEAGGYAVGVPPGWSEKQSAAKTTLRSPGSAVVASVTADRSNEALEANLAEYSAGIAMEVAPGVISRPIDKPPVPDLAGYESAGVTVLDGDAPPPVRGQGVAATGQRLQVVVVRRIGLAAYPVLVAGSAAIKPRQLDPVANELVRSLRGRPVGGGG